MSYGRFEVVLRPSSVWLLSLSKYERPRSVINNTCPINFQIMASAH